MENVRKTGSIILALTLEPHLSPPEFFALLGLLAAWMTPDWVIKLLQVAREVEWYWFNRYRSRQELIDPRRNSGDNAAGRSASDTPVTK